MIDRKAVIGGLKILKSDLPSFDLYGYGDHNHFATAIVNDAITLLYEQEPALPTWSQGKAYCGKCGQRLPRKRADKEINYCGYCGQEVKWNG